MKNNDNFYICLSLSIALHLLAIYIFLFGLPSLSNKLQDDAEEVITFEMLPVAAISNVPTQQKQLEKAIENEQAKEVKQSKPREEPKPVEEPKPQEIKEKELPKEQAETIVKEKQPDPKKQEPEKKKPKKKLPTSSDLDSLLKNLEASSQGSETKTNKRARANQNDAPVESKGSFNAAPALTISEKNIIMQQIHKQWNIPLAAQNIEEVAVTLRIELDKDGTVTNVKMIDKVCPNIPNSVCSALENSAERAVWQASPIKNLIQENYSKWKEFELTFYPKNAM